MKLAKKKEYLPGFLCAIGTLMVKKCAPSRTQEAGVKNS